MNPAKTGISRLLIASAIDPDVYRRLLESPEEAFDAFDLADEDRELLRHPDHRRHEAHARDAIARKGGDSCRILEDAIDEAISAREEISRLHGFCPSLNRSRP